MSISAVAFFSLWPILLTRDGESVIARGGDDPPIHGAVSDLGRR
jgi:hypothetical protein